MKHPAKVTAIVPFYAMSGGTLIALAADEIEPGKVTVIEFTPDRSGTFFISHKSHFHDIVGKLIVEE